MRKLNRYRTFILAAIAMLLPALTATAQSECSFLMQGGIYDYESTSNDISQLNSFVDWFRSQSFTSQEDAKTRNAGLKGYYQGAPWEGTYSRDEKGFQQKKQDIDAYKAGNSEYKEKLIRVVQKINPHIISAVSKCLETKGLHVWLETFGDDKHFVLAHSYVPDIEGRTSETVRAPFTPVNGRCKDIKPGSKIEVPTKRYVCDRIKPEFPVKVVFNATREPLGGRNLVLPAIPPLGPPVAAAFDGFGPYVILKGDSKTKINGPVCDAEQRVYPVPGSIIAVVTLAGGSWDIYNRHQQPVATRIAVNDNGYPVKIYGVEYDSNKIIPEILKNGFRTLSSARPFYVCIETPAPDGGYLFVTDGDPVKLQVRDSRNVENFKP